MYSAGVFLLPEHGKSRCLACASKGRVGQGSWIKRRYYCLWEHISAPHIGENSRLFMNSYCKLPDNSQFPRLPFIVSSAEFRLFVRSKDMVVVCPTRAIDSATTSSWGVIVILRAEIQTSAIRHNRRRDQIIYSALLDLDGQQPWCSVGRIID